MWTIFFDIDGTLIRTGGAGLVSMSKVMLRRYGVQELPQLPVHGRTDRGIWQDVFSVLELDAPTELTPLIDEYCDELQANLNDSSGHELPGVKELLGLLSSREDVACCLLTGNARRAAKIKLDAFGLTEYFKTADSTFVGGFGDSTPCRNQVARLAVESAKQRLQRFDPNRIWVIGDTKRDVECARAIDAKVLAVKTGGETMEELVASQPDRALLDLSDVQQVVKILTG